MSDEIEIPGQQAFAIDEPTAVAAPRSRRRAMIAGVTAAAVGVAFAGWGVSGALASSPGTAGFPHAATLVAGSSAKASAAARSVAAAVVDITATDGFQDQEDEGTGMVITSDGDVLTNNHVIDGATSIMVTLTGNGKAYRAAVLGTDAADDVALLRMVGASKLSTIPVGDATNVTKGIAVTAVGNALGRGGTPSITSGAITGTGRSITASDGNGSASERLSGLFETDADIISGDSGGPLVDSSGQVIAMDTAAQESGSGEGGFEDAAITSSSDGYAIPITTALTIAREIAADKASSTIEIGTPGILGVQVGSDNDGGFGGFGSYGGYATPTATGAAVAGVVSGSPAAAAGITAGDTITSIDGTTVTTAEALTRALAKAHGGDRVSVGWVAADGASHHATTTLIAGPAA
ncbi:MAG TPA: trypsin-like peptidase domain-containing protein [Mycobacteriales bacterium]|nr:trypsin-like peptidase domain-containing protein [Mycobacteriales bacterium]